jgi:3D-(3,5/4)-trihydroxycyclohexane-1,2-dione acylhydrolase (decyclizing)
VQAEAYDYPESFFDERVWSTRRPEPDRAELAAAAAALKAAEKPVIIAGGGVLYSEATATLKAFAEAHAIPVMETQAGKSSLRHDHANNLGSVGVTGSSASNALAEDADLVLAVGTRLQDFTTGSWALFRNGAVKVIGLNTQPFDATKHGALPLVADARVGLEALHTALGAWQAPARWLEKGRAEKAKWLNDAAAVTRTTNDMPSDAQVIGAVQRAVGHDVVLLAASGGLPGELHKLWQAGGPGSYHLEYGYSCMGYEIAGGLGVKLARPDAEVVVMLGDGGYLMANSELATAVMLGAKITLVVLDNRGFGCINRLQMATGGANFNNLFKDARHTVLPDIDFAAHAAALGAKARKVQSVGELETALADMKREPGPAVIVIETDPLPSTEAGGAWWDVAVPEVSSRAEVRQARAAYEAALRQRQPA